MKLLNILFLAISGVYNAEAILGSTALSEAEMTRLQRGEIITRELEEPRKGQTFEAHAIFPANKQRTVEVITDFANYPEFMPGVERIDILARNDNRTILNYHLSLPLGKKKRYRLLLIREEQADATIIQWRMLDWPEVPEDERIGNTTGFWVLKPFKSNQTLVRYYVYTDPGEVPFGLEWIIEYLSEDSIPELMQNTRKYAGSY
jgi:hypothetical protein